MAAAAKELPACPVETTLTLISDKWKVLILRDLMPGTKRFWRIEEVHRLGQPESADGPAPGDGAERPADPYGLSGGPAPRGIHADRPGVQPETHSGRHEELGRGV